LKVDLHNHTYLCKHAMGTAEQYVQKAIEQKIDVFGFSDHNPMNFDKTHRMEYYHKDDYIRIFKDVKQNFSKDIKLLFGYEFDYLDYRMNKELLKYKVDYLIGSIHFINDFGVDDPNIIKEFAQKNIKFKNKDIDLLWEDYFMQIKKMATTGYFNIVGHIDLVKILTKKEPSKDIRLIAKDALKAIKNSGMSVEINASALRKGLGEAYPSRKLLEEIFSYDIPITFGSDAHQVDHIGYEKEYCENLAKDIGFKQCVYYENRETVSVAF